MSDGRGESKDSGASQGVVDVTLESGQQEPSTTPSPTPRLPRGGRVPRTILVGAVSVLAFWLWKVDKDLSGSEKVVREPRSAITGEAKNRSGEREMDWKTVQSEVHKAEKARKGEDVRAERIRVAQEKSASIADMVERYRAGLAVDVVDLRHVAWEQGTEVMGDTGNGGVGVTATLAQYTTVRVQQVRDGWALAEWKSNGSGGKRIGWVPEKSLAMGAGEVGLRKYCMKVRGVPIESRSVVEVVGRGGPYSILIENIGADETLVRISYDEDEIRRTIFLGPGDTGRISDLPQGTVTVYAQTGKNWSTGCEKFLERDRFLALEGKVKLGVGQGEKPTESLRVDQVQAAIVFLDAPKAGEPSGKGSVQGVGPSAGR